MLAFLAEHMEEDHIVHRAEAARTPKISFEQVAKAHEYLESNRQVGKVVVVLSDAD